MQALLQTNWAKQGLDEIATLMKYADAFGIDSYISFDLSLARGLDYYTGLIYEAVTSASAPPKNASELKKKAKSVEDASEYVGVGSIAAGGRYDNLVNMFAEASGKKSAKIPCVGISFGVERLFSLIKQRIDPLQTSNQLRHKSLLWHSVVVKTGPVTCLKE